MKNFEALNVSSKYAICGLPIRVDTYKTCSFGCKYCFSNCRKIMEFEKTLAVANLPSVERRLSRIFEDKKFKEDNFLDTLISQGITWHMGGMSDPFQPVEQKLQITKGLLDITNRYGIHILSSTKADTVYDCDIRPDLHTFQLSVSNIDNRKDLEPNVPDIEKRYKFYHELKRDACCLASGNCFTVPDACLNFADMCAAHHKHAKTRLTYTATDGEGEFATKERFVEGKSATVVAAGFRELIVESSLVNTNAH